MAAPPNSTRSSDDLQKLYERIEKAAKAGNFQAAELEREKLLEAHPMAIHEAIAAAEIIENEMSAAVDKDHLAIWPELYDPLTPGERNCIFHSLKKFVLPDKRILLQYGSLNNKLFFIEKGRVDAYLPQKNKKHKLIGQLGRGDVLGEYTFATIALCSATAATASEVHLRVLEGQQAEGWENKHPGLYSKLLDFCRRHGQIDQISARQEQEHHTHPRTQVGGRVKAVLLDKNGKDTGVKFTGEVEEISRSGASFTIHSNKKETVRKLLAQPLSLSFSLNHKQKKINFSCKGRVIRVSFMLYNDYILHISFDSLLPRELITKLTS